MGKTTIEWTHGNGFEGRTWNPLRGCSLDNLECTNCFAQSIAFRFNGPGQAFEGFAHKVNGKPRWTNLVETLPDKLNEPFSWKKPAMVFVNSMADLFHKDVSLDFIKRVFDVMNRTQEHTYQILTKRHDRLADIAARGDVEWTRNIWQGVSAGRQVTADEKIPALLTVPAKVLFVSAEPLLGPIRLKPCWLGSMCSKDCENVHKHNRQINWIIAGCESGPGARPMNEDWVRSIRDQCIIDEVAFFYKQRLNEHGHKVPLPELDGRQWNEYPNTK